MPLLCGRANVLKAQVAPLPLPPSKQPIPRYAQTAPARSPPLTGSKPLAAHAASPAVVRPRAILTTQQARFLKGAPVWYWAALNRQKGNGTVVSFARPARRWFGGLRAASQFDFDVETKALIIRHQHTIHHGYHLGDFHGIAMNSPTARVDDRKSGCAIKRTFTSGLAVRATRASDSPHGLRITEPHTRDQDC